MIKYQKTKGKLICIEGLDGSQKAQVADLLTEELRSRGNKVFVYHLKPFDNALLATMHQNLSLINQAQEHKIPEYNTKHFNLDPLIIHTQFFLYLASFRKSLMYKLAVCDYVIIDSWVYKNVVYSLINKVPKNYIMNLVRNVLPKPYLVVFLDIHEKQSYGQDMFDDMFTLEQAKTNYYILRKYAKERWITVNIYPHETVDNIVYQGIIPKMKKNI